MTHSVVKLGIRENWPQFFILLLVNALVGAMIGLERSILPKIAEEEFGLVVKTAILSFIVVFGFTKAVTNYFAGRLADRSGRKLVLVWGWLAAVPVPFLLMWADSWNGILLANVFLGISQGLTWSTTVIMNIDLVGSERRGLAVGLNEFAGYLAIAVSALATGFIAAEFGLRPEPFYLGVAYIVVGLFLSLMVVRETHHHVQHESMGLKAANIPALSQKDIFLRTTLTDRYLSAVTQAGFVKNLNDGMAWGLFPLFFASRGATLDEVGWLVAIYPATWGICQLWTGHLSDSMGRKLLIVGGMWLQGVGIAATVLTSNFPGFVAGGVLLGVGSAMVYPTLLAAIGDVAHPSWRASSVGVYRFWRDAGYAVGAIVSGIVSDAFGVEAAIWFVAGLTFLSGALAALRMDQKAGRRTV